MDPLIPLMLIDAWGETRRNNRPINLLPGPKTKLPEKKWEAKKAKRKDERMARRRNRK
jgi:hypothetical protein